MLLLYGGSGTALSFVSCDPSNDATASLGDSPLKRKPPLGRVVQEPDQSETFLAAHHRGDVGAMLDLGTAIGVRSSHHGGRETGASVLDGCCRLTPSHFVSNMTGCVGRSTFTCFCF